MRLQPRDRFEVDSDYEILASLEVVREVTNGITIDASKVPAAADGSKVIKKGMPMSKSTANGKWRPYTGGVVAENITKTTDSSAELYDASRYVAGDVLTFADGSNTEQKTVQSVDLTTNVITFTAAFTNDFAKDVTTVRTADGGENPSVILKRSVNVKDGDHVVAGFEVAKVIAARIPVTVDATLKSKMPHIIFS